MRTPMRTLVAMAAFKFPLTYDEMIRIGHGKYPNFRQRLQKRILACAEISWSACLIYTYEKVCVLFIRYKTVAVDAT